MTDRKSRRVVIINNINSDTIDQAIFILKSDKKDIALNKNPNSDIVREAQNIINNYIRQVERLKSSKADLKKTSKKGFGMITAVLCLAAVLIIVGCIIR